MSEDQTISPCVELVDNRAAVLREINVAIEHLRHISDQFHGNEGLARLAMHQEIVKQICELATLIVTVSK